MTRMISKAVLSAAIASATLLTAMPAEAQRWGGGRHGYYNNNGYGGGYYRGGRGRGYYRGNTGAAIGAGLLGLGVGLALSNSNRGYYDGGYYGRPYYGRGYGGGYYGRRCTVERYFDDWEGRWVRVRRCW